MRAGGPGREVLWVDGRITVRVRGLGFGTGRSIPIRRPFAIIGRHPGADIRIVDETIDDRHVLLILDDRGIFGVDLRTRLGTRFAGLAADSARLSVGDILEVAGRRIELVQLRVGGSVVAPPLSDDDLLAEADPSRLASLTLEPLDVPGPPWTLGSALAFVGRGEACAIRIDSASIAETDCALLRTESHAYVIDLLGGPTLVNDRPIDRAWRLLDHDILTIGQIRFTVRVGPVEEPTGLALKVARGSRAEILEAIRRFPVETAAVLEAQVDRIETLGREIESLRNQLEDIRAFPVEPLGPFRLDLPARTPSSDVESATWLLDRIHDLEPPSRSTWYDLVDRIAATVRHRSTAKP